MAETIDERAEFQGRSAALLLGSVSHAAVLHARCPVVVIPAAAQEQKPAVLR